MLSTCADRFIKSQEKDELKRFHAQAREILLRNDCRSDLIRLNPKGIGEIGGHNCRISIRPGRGPRSFAPGVAFPPHPALVLGGMPTLPNDYAYAGFR